MLYELLTGELPQGRFKTPKERVPDHDPRLDDIVMRLLDHEPQRRPKRALEVAAAIDSSLHGPRVGGPVDVPMGRRPPFEQLRGSGGRRPAKARRPWLAAGVGLLLLLVAAAAWWVWPASKAKPLAARLEPSGTRTGVVFGAGESGLFSAYGAGWRSTPLGLERTAVAEAGREERTYLARALADGGSVELEVESGSGKNQGAEVVLVAQPDRFAGLRIAEGKARLVGSAAAGAKVTDVVLDSNLRTHRVLLQSDGVHLSASVDGRSVGQAVLPDGRAPRFIGVGCVGAACRFTSWQLTGGLDAVATGVLAAAAEP
jgi:hypothetical protein